MISCRERERDGNVCVLTVAYHMKPKPWTLWWKHSGKPAAKEARVREREPCHVTTKFPTTASWEPRQWGPKPLTYNSSSSSSPFPSACTCEGEGEEPFSSVNQKAFFTCSALNLWSTISGWLAQIRYTRFREDLSFPSFFVCMFFNYWLIMDLLINYLVLIET